MWFASLDRVHDARDEPDPGHLPPHHFHDMRIEVLGHPAARSAPPEPRHPREQDQPVVQRRELNRPLEVDAAEPLDPGGVGARGAPGSRGKRPEQGERPEQHGRPGSRDAPDPQ